jgi:hypothetical protein
MYIIKAKFCHFEEKIAKIILGTDFLANFRLGSDLAKKYRIQTLYSWSLPSGAFPSDPDADNCPDCGTFKYVPNLSNLATEKWMIRLAIIFTFFLLTTCRSKEEEKPDPDRCTVYAEFRIRGSASVSNSKGTITPVLRIRICKFRMFLDLPDPSLFVRIVMWIWILIRILPGHQAKIVRKPFISTVL